MARTFDTPLFSSDQSIDRVLGAGLPVLLAFVDGAANAGFTGELERQAREQAGNLLVVQVPLKDNPQTRQRYGVHSAPALVTLRDGQVLSKAEGVTAQDVQSHANYLLGKGPRPAERAAPSAAPPGASAQAAGSPSASGTRSTAPAGEGRPKPVTDQTFEQEVMRSAQPVLVDFWAPWCGPCRMTDPILEKLAREMSGKMKIAKVNVDENPMAAGRYGVQAIPTMMLVKDGRIIDRWSGALPEGALRSRISARI